MKIEFTVFKDGQPLKTINAELPVVIGRGTDSTLTIKHPLLSRKHCEVYKENGQVFVKDLASLNGTFVNEARVETSLLLTSGSQLKLGAVEIQVSFDGGAVSASADADFEMGAFGSAETEPISVAEATPADIEASTFDLGDFEVGEPAVAAQAPVGDDAQLDLADFEVTEANGATEAPAVVGDAVAEAESLDLGDFEVSTPEVSPADDMLDLEGFELGTPPGETQVPEAQVERPSLMELAGGLDDVPADPDPAPSSEAAPLATDEPVADDPWAALPAAENQVNADDDDLDAFLADLS